MSDIETRLASLEAAAKGQLLVAAELEETMRELKEILEGSRTAVQSDEIADLASGLSKAQAEIKNPQKNRENPHFKSKYADLGAVLDAIRPAFSKNGLSLVQLTKGDLLITMIVHDSGQWLRSVAPIQPDREGIQAYGSARTYLRRYEAQSIAGIAAEDDDDGNAPATEPPAHSQRSEPPRMLEVFHVQHGQRKGYDLRKVTDGQKLVEYLDKIPRSANAKHRKWVEARIEELLIEESKRQQDPDQEPPEDPGPDS